MPKVRKPRRGRGPLPPPGYPGYEPAPPVYPGEEKERESKEYETENPPPYDPRAPPPYEDAPLIFDPYFRVYRPHNPAYDQPVPNNTGDELAQEEQRHLQQLQQNEQSIAMYSNPPPEFNPVHVRRVLNRLLLDNSILRAAIASIHRRQTPSNRDALTQRLREIQAATDHLAYTRPGNSDARQREMAALIDEHTRIAAELQRGIGGGRIVNAHAKKTGVFMRKHKLSLGEASRRAAAHSRNAKSTKAKKGAGRSGRTTRVSGRPQRT